MSSVCFTLPETKPASLPLKMDGWNTCFLLGVCLFSGAMLVSGSVLKAIKLRLSLVQVPKNLFGQNSCLNLSPLPSTTQVFRAKRQWCPMHRIGELDHLASATFWRSLRYMDVSKNRGILPPIWMVYFMENPIKMG